MRTPVSLVARRFAPRAVPWLRVYTIATAVYRRVVDGWGELTAEERARLGRILRDSKGRPNMVSQKDRRELRGIVTKALRAAARGRG